MALLNRQTLKSYFKKGSFPSEVHYAHLIDSMLNVVDDGIGRGVDEGFRLTPQGISRRLLSFFSGPREKQADWVVAFNDKEGLQFQRPGQEPVLFLDKDTRVGIGTSNPLQTLDVKGTCGMESRTGTFKRGKVPADGKWHNLMAGLDGIQAFEIMAMAGGRPGSGKYALTHAIALSTFGGFWSKSAIKATTAHYGGFFNRLQLRWSGTVHDFSLQARTRSHYGIEEQTGEPYAINFHIVRLWQEGDLR
jgi:hypothetical protein